jgi:hypothetical protein
MLLLRHLRELGCTKQEKYNRFNLTDVLGGLCTNGARKRQTASVNAS